jgi:hypothetical protein
MREWQHQMTEHFGGMPPPEEMGQYMEWRPPPVPPVSGRPASFDVSLAATPGIATLATIGSVPTSRDSPHAVVRHDVQRRRRHSTDSTTGSQALPPPHTRPRTGSTEHLTSPASASAASSSRTSPAPSQTRSSPGTSARANLASSGPGRGRRGCCGGDDDVDCSAHVVTTNSDRVGQETPVSRSYYTLDDAGGIVIDGTGRGARRYLLELVTCTSAMCTTPRLIKMG